MPLYNDATPYNTPSLTYAGQPNPALAGTTLCYNMNRLAGTIVNGVPQYDTDGAAVLWGIIVLGTVNASRRIDVLNQIYASRNGGKNYAWDIQGVLNGLAGTVGLGENEASSRIPS